MKKILTLSVAAYNIGNYIDKLMNSILSCNQKERLEILLVNDGSKDDTLLKSNDYQKRFPSIVTVIDKHNGGHGSTINAGINNATAKYFKAIDGDDWVDSSGLDSFISHLKETDVDLVLSDFLNVYEENGTKKRKTMNLTPGHSYKFDSVAEKLNGICYHNICYKTELLKTNNIKLTEHSFYVDNEFIAYPILFVQTVAYYNDLVYCYRLGREEQSVSIISSQKNVQQHFLIVKYLIDFYNDNSTKCSNSKKEFYEDFISVVASFQLLIRFSFSISRSHLKELIIVDNYLMQCPSVYSKMKNKTFIIWRKNRVLLYIPIKLWIDKKRSGRSTVA